MADFTAKDVQNLRQSAEVGMMDAKNALKEADGHYDRAFEILRERGLAKLAKRADKEASDGAIGSYIHYQNERAVMGVLIELACETDFVAKSPEFRDAADDIAMHVSWSAPRWITREEVDRESLDEERALITKQAEADGKPEHVIPKIVEGRIESFLKENVLYDQEFVNQDKFEGTVGEMVTKLASKMGENISIRQVSRVAVGEAG
ncbi:MAG: elongation factor Ts [Acidimicrobiia bacterium]|nr:elongation factor Ts [Acidimicrobiia bacterium]